MSGTLARAAVVRKICTQASVFCTDAFLLRPESQNAGHPEYRTARWLGLHRRVNMDGKVE